MCKWTKIDIAKMKERILNSKLHVLTFATHEQGYFRTLQESCKSLNIDLQILGMGNKWEGFIAKLIKVKEYLKSCNDKDIILFVDGFDTFFVQPANVIIERYIINYDNLFVCTSESTYSSNLFFLRVIENMHLIFHNSIFKNNDNTQWDSTNIKEKYKDFTHFHKNLNLLNSGGWISNVFLAKKILQYIPSFIENDQIFLTNLYLDCNYLLKFKQDKSLICKKKNNFLDNCNPQENVKYYNRIIVDNHNIIFHLFRSKENVVLLSYQDCVNFFPFRPLLNSYYLNGQVKTTSVVEKKKKKTAISSIMEFLKKKKKGEDGSEMSEQKLGEDKTDDLKFHANGEYSKKKKKLVQENNKSAVEWMKQKTILDDVYMDEGERKIGQIEKTFNYSIIDTHTHTSPCVLHMHCLRNIDGIISTMGLKNLYTSKWYSNIWYLFYSLKGTLNFNYFSLLFSTVVAVVTLLLIQMKYLLAFLKYIDTALGINFIRAEGHISRTMFLLDDIVFSCFVSFILAILFWIFYIFNKKMG
ncbi:hypothetical protein, conserved [Plasmodium gonderi]|uniref:PLOD1-3-like GT domain-containing protein n=1 Tax=Plasmodium gonderi TaxID=77519 RepID=A0A1Y1JIT0_PLAGO|nr:hypothetical protein, conserved [Plasmodium gonderi]GAW80363.1 hypothetical protein, conserved [Plasmodium gonderi]